VRESASAMAGASGRHVKVAELGFSPRSFEGGAMVGERRTGMRMI